jgi:hypothetical protein
MQLTLLGTEIKKIIGYGGNLYHFTDGGVDVHRQSDGVRIAWAVLANVTAGAVNDNGVYLGTSAAGVYLLPHAAVTTGGDQAGALVQTYTTGSSPSLQSNQVNGMAGRGTALLITGPAGADYLPSASTVYRYVDAGGCGAGALAADRLAYSVTSGMHYLRSLPAADWTEAITLKTSVVFDDFVGTNGAAPSAYWEKVGATSGTIEIQSNALRVRTNAGAAVSVRAATLWRLPGDFDVRARVANVDNVATSATCVCGLSAYQAGASLKARASAQFESSGAYWQGRHWVDGVGEQTNVARSGYSGELRLTRNGNTLTSYYRATPGAAWTQLRQTTDATLNGVELVLSLETYSGSGGPAYGGDWDYVHADAASMTNGPPPRLLSDTVRDVRFGADLFVATDAGVSIWDGSVLTNITTPLGTVLNVKSIHPISTATKNSGLLAYGTSDGLDGGRFGVLDLAGV